MKQPRDYQLEDIETIIRKNNEGVQSILCCQATGLGKSFLGSQIAARFKKVLWLTHRVELIYQSAKVLEAETGRAVGIIRQKEFEVEKEIVVASIQTLYNRLDLIDPNTFDCVIVDEVHLALSMSFSTTINHFKPKLLLGLTATPTRLDGLSLMGMFDEMVVDRDILFGIKNGWLVELDAVRVKTTTNLDKVRTTGGELNAADLRLIDTPERNKLIVDKWIEHAKDRATIVFCVDMKHAQSLTQAFKDAAINASFIVSDTTICPDREERLAAFFRGEITVMMNVEILTVGVDFPGCSCIIHARPTKSLVFYLQGTGRSTRPLIPLHEYKSAGERILAIQKSKKPNSLILDIVDNTSKHSLINTWTLDNGKRFEEMVFLTTEKREALIEKRRLWELKHTLDKDVKVKLLTPPVIKMAGKWMKEPPTEAQLKYLSSFGYDITNNSYTKGQVAKLISDQPAYPIMVNLVKDKGYDVSKGLTLGQANEILKLKAKKDGKRTIS